MDNMKLKSGGAVGVTAADTELAYRPVAQGSSLLAHQEQLLVRVPLTLLFAIGSTWHEMATVTQWLCVR
jgi:hypothetical protein